MTATKSVAQWQKTVDQMLDMKWDPQAGGVLEYHEGTVWAAGKDIFYSRDLGLNWTQVPRFIDDGDWVTTIRFFGDTAFLSTIDGHLWRSFDNGQSWTRILEESMIGGLTFTGSGHDLVVLFAAPGSVWRSTDAGNSWSRDTLESFAQDIAYARGLTVATLVNDVNGHLWHSNDSGRTWQKGAASFNYDSFSLSLDSCTNNVYVVNEEERNVLDGICKVLVSSDLGDTWRVTLTHDREYLGGTIVSGPTALYASTLVDGVLRSTDHGETWQSIGGPNLREDTRFILPIDDNLLLAVDQDGSVWRTTNSGGFPITVSPNVFRLSRSDLFAGATVASCNVAFDSTYLTRAIGDCSGPLEVTRQEIIGPDAKYYQLLDTVSHTATPLDTLALLFAPDSSRDYNATLRLTLWNGETRDIALSGHGTTTPHIVLSTINISTDVIGDVLSIPIKSDQPIQRSCDIRVSYDPTPVEYAGLAPGYSGVTEVSNTPGTLVLHISGSNTLALDSTIAIVRFRFLPVSGATTSITIDSLTYAPDSACGDFSPATALITSTADSCSRTILAKYVKTGEAPTFSISPNPASSVISIRADHDRNAEISIYNSLGQPLLHRNLALGHTSTPLDISDLPEGPATITISSDGFTRGYRILILHR